MGPQGEEAGRVGGCPALLPLPCRAHVPQRWGVRQGRHGEGGHGGRSVGVVLQRDVYEAGALAAAASTHVKERAWRGQGRQFIKPCTLQSRGQRMTPFTVAQGDAGLWTLSATRCRGLFIVDAVGMLLTKNSVAGGSSVQVWNPTPVP